MTNIPRNEYPRPQLVREDWINLNGEWQFEIDNGRTGLSNIYHIFSKPEFCKYDFNHRDSLKDKIIVPFSPESKLSGIGNTDFMDCVWYLKEFEIPSSQKGKRTIIHFGAVDYHAIVYVNKQPVGEHKGGYSSFSFDITDFLKDGKNTVTVCAIDDIRSTKQPSGKQSIYRESEGCFYTRTTGIWQTVWLEFVPKNYIKNFKTFSDIENVSVNFDFKLSDYCADSKLKITAFYNEKEVGNAETSVEGMNTNVTVKLTEKHLWEVGNGELYDFTAVLTDENGTEDKITGYFGLRSVALTEKAFTLNGKKVFGRWVLDQGFYPDGIYTAPTDEALKADIEYSMKLGFNGARLHEKIFEPRFLYWADKLGYLVWGEYPNWGVDIRNVSALEYILPEWLEAMERDFAHPSIIGWCPMNETWDAYGGQQSNELLRIIYLATKAADTTRPVIDTSGNFHVVTDIYDVHDYSQDPKEFHEHYDNKYYEPHPLRQTRKGEPYFVSEYGGIQWSYKSGGDAWGYGNAPKTEEEFIERYRGLTEVLLKDEKMLGFCYTQLYDVEQEQNGLMTYDRQFKFDPEIFYKINAQKAKIEE